MASNAARSVAWLAGLIVLLLPGLADALCIPVAQGPLRPTFASYRPAAAQPGTISLTYIGHSSFVIETAGGVTAVTDYNGYVKPPFVPTVVSMNNAHSTHFTEFPEPQIKHVLRGWATSEGESQYQIVEEDLRVHNVPTNVREYGGTRFNGNSIFVFESAGICIAHLGHLHHTLTDQHLGALGKIDVLLVPVDGMYTMDQFDMIEVIRQIRPAIVVPMHFFSEARLSRFLDRLRTEADFTIQRNTAPSLTLNAATLPNRQRPEVWVLPGY
jgi:L-ascorbate metabolism protein UlaG (beta-lactamase superfamily)